MGMKLITAASPVVTWADADAHLRLSGDNTDQAYVESLIAACTARLDGWNGILGIALGSQTWELTLDRFPCGEETAIRLPVGPLISVTSVKYDDVDGDEQTVDSGDYQTDDTSVMGPWIVPVSGYSWPSTLDAVNAVRVRYVAGHATLPDPLKVAILMHVAHLYDNREAAGRDMSETPLGYEEMIYLHKRSFFG